MLDHLRLSIPVLPTHVRSLANHHTFNDDLLRYGLPAATRNVSRTDDGNILTGTLYHPYESLGSDFTDMAMKFYLDTMNTLPYVEIKASPLKLLQGHNVYGFESIKLGAIHMLGMLQEAYPALCSILDFKNIEVLHLDTTYFVKLPHQNMVQPVLDYLANCQAGHRKANQVKYQNYITWGSEDGRYIRPKAYGKFEEVKSQQAKTQKLADKGCQRSKALVTAMQDVLQFSNACVRFEARICKTYLTKNGYPTNLWELIKRQEAEIDLLQKFWHAAFDPILNTLKGEFMNRSTDDEILESLREKLKTITPTGKTSYSKANNAFKFYCLVRQIGWTAVKNMYSESSFYECLKSLTEEKEIDGVIHQGISKSHLQNLSKNQNGKVIPFVRLVEIKFDQQLPEGYQIPVSKYAEQLGYIAA